MPTWYHQELSCHSSFDSRQVNLHYEWHVRSVNNFAKTKFCWDSLFRPSNQIFQNKIYIWIFGLICERLEKWTWFASNLFLQQRLRLSWCQICALIWGMSCLKNIINSTGNHYRSDCYSCPLACLKYSTADHKTPHN